MGSGPGQPGSSRRPTSAGVEVPGGRGIGQLTDVDTAFEEGKETGELPVALLEVAIGERQQAAQARLADRRAAGPRLAHLFARAIGPRRAPGRGRRGRRRRRVPVGRPVARPRRAARRGGATGGTRARRRRRQAAPRGAAGARAPRFSSSWWNQSTSVLPAGPWRKEGSSRNGRLMGCLPARWVER